MKTTKATIHNSQKSHNRKPQLEQLSRKVISSPLWVESEKPSQSLLTLVNCLMESFEKWSAISLSPPYLILQMSVCGDFGITTPPYNGINKDMTLGLHLGHPHLHEFFMNHLNDSLISTSNNEVEIIISLGPSLKIFRGRILPKSLEK